MNKDELFKMFKDEAGSKVDAETLKRLECAKTKTEALSILKSVSIDLSDDLLASISGGAEEDDDAIWCTSACPGHGCKIFYYTTS